MNTESRFTKLLLAAAVVAVAVVTLTWGARGSSAAASEPPHVDPPHALNARNIADLFPTGH